MKKIKDLVYIIGVNCLIVFFSLSLAINIVELLNPILKVIIDMLLGIITFYICKDITKILSKEVKNVLYDKTRKIK